MSKITVSTAMLQCTFGLAPGTLMVLPSSPSMMGGMPAATIMDHKAFVNILPFGMCTSLSNPTVAAATSAALGVLTPLPCIPVTPAPWAPGSVQISVGGLPGLNDTSKCNCAWGGVISITMPGQFTIEVP